MCDFENNACFIVRFFLLLTSEFNTSLNLYLAGIRPGSVVQGLSFANPIVFSQCFVTWNSAMLYDNEANFEYASILLWNPKYVTGGHFEEKLSPCFELAKFNRISLPIPVWKPE